MRGVNYLLTKLIFVLCCKVDRPEEILGGTA